MSNVKIQSEISGMLGEIVSVRKIGKRLVVKNRPQLKLGKPSDKQQLVQQNFNAARLYAKKQLAQPDSNALYTAGITEGKKSAYQVAFRDYLIAPKVVAIDTLSYHGAIGDSILVIATDDFMVTKVKVIIINAAGELIEQGEAVMDEMKNIQWEYKPTIANPTLAGTKIKAVAYDRPGNKGSAEVTL